MVKVFVGRLGSAVVLLLGLVSVVFVISRLAPGDPVSMMASPTLSEELLMTIRQQYGFDRPLIVQYFDWIWNTVRGDLGISIRHFLPVIDVIRAVLPNTILLAATAITLQVTLGVLLASIAVRYHGTIVDKAITNINLITYTLPTFWIGVVLLAAMSFGMGWFPPGHMYSIGIETQSWTEQFWDLIKHLALPSLTIAIPGAAAIAKYYRSSLLSARDGEHVLFARSLGISERSIFLRHQFPLAAGPIVTLVGLELGTLLAGALVTETLFAWPGMGRLTIQAIFSRDYPLIMGCSMVAGAMVIMGNFLADLAYAVIDPRVRYS